MTESTPITALEARRAEVAQYATNIAMYAAIASSLPSEWPDRLVQHKNATDKHATIATIENLNDVELVSDLWAYDQAQASIRAETVEMRKSQAILTFLESQAE
jgi:hypothetical protein